MPFFFFFRKKTIKQTKKYYPIDSGLRYAITSTVGRDLGKSLELAVFLHLKRTHDQVFYWQEIHKGEVNFVAIRGNTITPYQVTWGTPELRHEKALQRFYENFPYANEAVFITGDNATEFLLN